MADALYDGDSFFTLTPWAQAGLVAVSAAMVALLVLGLHLIARHLIARHRIAGRWPVAWRLPLAGVGFLGFLWLSPQVHYFYYRAVIEGLPPQVVIGWPVGPLTAGRLMLFAGRDSLADHARGVLGWGLVCWALLPVFRKR